jgi:CBS domain-containing protein
MHAMRRDVPTCRLDDRAGEVRAALSARDWEIAVVVDEAQIVLGLLHSDAWESDPATLVEDVMSNGPPTTRPSTFLDEMVERLERRKTPGIVISSSDGVLMGYLWTSEAVAYLDRNPCDRTWTDRDCSPSEEG